MNDVIEQINLQIEKYSLLKHKFYKMWSEGELTMDHLKGYSKEYFQLVKSVPQFVENISQLTNDPSVKAVLTETLNEESEHIDLWVKFAVGLGVPKEDLLDYQGSGKTNDAVSRLKSLTSLSLEEGAGAMYAYEMEIPKISRSKLEGLKKFYGVDNSHDNGNTTRYFQIHEQVDVRHAATWRQMLQNLADESKTKSVFESAVRSLEAQNKLLDSVQEKYVA
jgi:pyrroloquinoline-quinone synthase